MTISMHSASVPVFVRMLGNVLNWLDKAQAHAEARKFDTANYLGLRLAPDMLPFTVLVKTLALNGSSSVAHFSLRTAS